MSIFEDIEKTYNEITKENEMYKNGIIRFCKQNKDIEKLVYLVIHRCDFELGSKERYMSNILMQIMNKTGHDAYYSSELFFNLYEFILEYINITDDKYNYEEDGDFFLPYKCVLKFENNCLDMKIYDVDDIDSNKVPENATSSASKYLNFIEEQALKMMIKFKNN